MIAASFQDYLPVSDLVKILVAAVLVALVAPAGVAVAIGGLDRRADAGKSGGSTIAADALIATGLLVLVALVGIGIYALTQK